MTKEDYIQRLLNNLFDSSDFDEEMMDKYRTKIENYVYNRSIFELWCDMHNHKLGFFRTIFSALNLITASLVALKIFGVI